jgi:hypothetical protein
MLLQFKNTHIFFAIESIWENLDYKYRYQLNQIITANSDEDYVQTLEVPEDILIQIFSTVTVQPEGVAAFINQEMLTELLGQIQPLSNLEAVQAGTEAPNEAARILIAINEIDVANKAVKDAKILRGKNQILA